MGRLTIKLREEAINSDNEAPIIINYSHKQKYQKNEVKKFNTGLTICPKYFNVKKQLFTIPNDLPELKRKKLLLIKKTIEDKLSFIDSIIFDINVAGDEPTVNKVVDLYQVKFKKSTSAYQSDFFSFFEKFIELSVKGKRTKKKTGLKLSPSIITNYKSVLKTFQKFEAETKYEITFSSINEKFYDIFISWCYENDLANSYINKLIRVIKTVVNYAVKLKVTHTTAINDFGYLAEVDNTITLSPEQLDYLMHLDLSNNKSLEVTRDIFVFGCFVGSRVSDLLSLKEENITFGNKIYYLKYKPAKTKAEDIITKLHPFAVHVYKKYKGIYPTILPPLGHRIFNRNLKVLGKHCQWDVMTVKNLARKGVITTENFEFYKLLTTHVMRKTAITTLLRQGVNENVVKKLSGHAQNSKSFAKYVSISQSYIDESLNLAHSQLPFKPKK